MTATNDIELEECTLNSFTQDINDYTTDTKGTGDEAISSNTKPEVQIKTSGPNHGLVFGIEDMPPWYTTILLGLQHFMTSFGGNVSTVFILSQHLCIDHDAGIKGELIGTLFVVTGLITILQSTFGVRLPIIQGATFAFVVPTIAILNLRGECPPATTEEEREASESEWLSRITEIQGAIMVASCVQVLIGATGIVGILMNFIGPLTVTPTITLIGLSLHKTAAAKSGLHWGIAFMTIVLVIVFSQFLPEVGLPFLSYNSRKKCHVKRLKLFKVFPIILSIAVAWLFCYIFTVTGVFPDDPAEYGYRARTDLNSEMLEQSPWFRFPYPGQWGTPTVALSGVLGIVAGVLASIIESIGDYYACARMSGAPPPPEHAFNRGILMEGIGCVLAGAWGTGNGTTSHSENIGAIGLTKVGSRVVVQAAGCIMIATGLLSKLSALFATIPEPVVGGVLCVTFGMVTAVGLSNLQFIDLNSSRNLFITGFSIFMGLVVPHYFEENPGTLKTGSTEVDQILTVMLTTGMFIGGLLGILLDNTIPGTNEERGFLAWRQHTMDIDKEDEDEVTRESQHAEEKYVHHDINEIFPHLPKCYDFPFGMRFIRGWTWCRYLPFSPTFEGFKFRCCKKKCCVAERNPVVESIPQNVEKNV